MAGVPSLAEMLGAMPSSGVFSPSKHWLALNERNLAQLEDLGLPSFKRTVNQNYFNWVLSDPRDPQFRALLASWLRHPSLEPLRARFVDAPDTEVGERARAFGTSWRRRAYAVFVALVWAAARRRDRYGLLEDLEEPELGAPIVVDVGGRRVTQDLANSALELTSILEGLGGRRTGLTVLEIGGGYGRLAWLMLRELSELRYVAVDIPPALAIAEWYLTSLFPALDVARFRAEPSAAEVERARLAFLLPHQAAELELHANLVVNVSSLHEMTPDQVASYIAMIGRVAAGGHFYTKQWLRWRNPDDGIEMSAESYPIPAGWDVVFWRRHPVQVHFFEAMYRIPG